jgi:hypothetical protein
MAQRTGTYTLEDLLAARFATVRAVEFGIDTLVDVLANDLAVHNAIMEELLGEFADPTFDIFRRQGSSQDGEFNEVDEIGRTPTQKIQPGQTVGFPLRKFQHAIGWSQDYQDRASVQDFAQSQYNAQKAHRRLVARELKKALYGSVNYTWVDIYAPRAIDVPVKAFWNADGSAIPNGPNGEVFVGATHTHYFGSATLTTSAVDTLINTIVEHGFGARIRIFINRADETGWRALSGFAAYPQPEMTTGTAAGIPTNATLDITRLDNRAIGRYGAAEIWVKPWAMPNYAVALDIGSAAKPLAFRRDPIRPGLYTAANLNAFPLIAEYMQVFMGFGVWNRGNGAVLQFNNATYTVPTIT